MPSDSSIVLGDGAVQTIEANLVKELREKWISEGKLPATASETAALRAFLDEIKRWNAAETMVEYVVLPGDTWAGIAGRFLGDQTRFPEIIAFNQLPSNATLRAGQKLRIPLK
jgi:nucleoid-associated protein YgaU